MKKLLYSRVQETYLDTGPQYREKQRLQNYYSKKTSSVQYYRSTKQAITFVRRKNIQYHQQMQTAVDKKAARIQLDKKCSYLQQVQALGSTQTSTKSVNFQQTPVLHLALAPSCLKLLSRRAVSNSIIPLAFHQKLQS